MENRAYDRLFKSEYSKVLAAAVKIFGVARMDLAEDATQETLLTALHQWKIKGIPDNPTGWLIKVAKRKAIDIIRKNSRELLMDTSVSPIFTSEHSMSIAIDQNFNNETIVDDQLRLMFVCCHPSLSPESQLCLILQTLCGFSVSEIAKALLSEYGTIEKKLYRAKKQWRESTISLDWPGENEIPTRLNNVYTALYLLFNEGYHSADHATLIREDFMEEAIRLVSMLYFHPKTQNATGAALLSLMLFLYARRNSRIDASGNFIPLKDQDRSVWDKSMIEQANQIFAQAMQADLLSKYHLEAAIAQQHAIAVDYQSTHWNLISGYYYTLSKVYPNPIVEINRALAICESKDTEAALEVMHGIVETSVISNKSLYHAAYGEIYFRNGQWEKAFTHFEKAIHYSKSSAESDYFKSQMNSCRAKLL